MDNIFKDDFYRPEVTKYLNAVKKYITDTQQCLPDEYELQLRLLADNYNRYLNCIDVLRSEGTVYKAENGRQFINPTYRVLKDCESSMSALCKAFGLDTFSKSKIKLQDSVISPDNLISSLLDD